MDKRGGPDVATTSMFDVRVLILFACTCVEIKILRRVRAESLESEFRDAADETTSLLHRRDRDAAAPSRFDTGQFSFRDAAQ